MRGFYLLSGSKGFLFMDNVIMSLSCCLFGLVERDTLIISWTKVHKYGELSHKMMFFDIILEYFVTRFIFTNLKFHF